MASCDNGSDEHARARSWLGETLHPFNFIAVLRERYQIRRICAHSLKLYRRIARSGFVDSVFDIVAGVIPANL